MNNVWPMVSLAHLLTLDRRPVKVLADRTYQEIGVYCFGRGIFHKPPRSGVEVGDKDLFLIKEGDFIIQVTFAWEGAVAIAGKAENGLYGSVRFPTFQVNQQQCVPEFLLNYFRTPAGREQLTRICPGSAGRNRVLSIKRLPEVHVPVPPLSEQRRIVAKIDQLAEKIEEARRLRQRSVAELGVMTQAMKADVFPASCGTCVRDYMRFQTGYAFRSEWFSLDGVRLARNVNVGHGRLDWHEVVCLPKARFSEYDRFALREGDILISLDRPIISTGVKIAKVTKSDLPALLLQRVARVEYDAEHLVGDYLYHWLTSPHFIGAIDPGRSNGVPHISHKDIERIPFALPARSEQCRIVDYLNAIQTKVGDLILLQTQTNAELDAMLPAILDKAFKGEL